MNISAQSIYNWYRDIIRNPKYRWWITIGTLVYVISPIDIAPDFIPIIGQVDDIMILTLLVSEISQLVLDYAKSRQRRPFSSPDVSNNETIEVDPISVQ